MSENTLPAEQAVSAETKLAVLRQILPVVDRNPNLVLSGSLSQVLVAKERERKCVLTARDLHAVNDIDLMTLEFEHGRYDTLAKQATQPGFGVDCKIPQTFSYATQRGRELSEREVEVDTGTGQLYKVRITSPEYLLVTRASMEGGGKRDNGKIKKRISELQQMPSFSKDRFIELARLEINARSEVRKGTHKYWKYILRDEEPAPGETWEEFVRRKSADFPTTVDQAQVGNLIKSSEDAQATDFEDVRPISNLERFLQEFTEGEEATT